jgi:hypothetical protein
MLAIGDGLKIGSTDFGKHTATGLDDKAGSSKRLTRHSISQRVEQGAKSLPVTAGRNGGELLCNCVLHNDLLERSR